MATFADGESGLSVRTKINNVLQHADGTAGELVINENGGDVDFRVESDTNANALFVDGANGRLGLGTGTPTTRLSVYGPNSAIADAITKTVAIFDTRTAAAGTGGAITFGGYFDGTTSFTEDFVIIAGIKENATAGDYATAFTVATRGNGGGPAERLRITSGGNVGIGIGTSTPQAKLHVLDQIKVSNAAQSQGALVLGDGGSTAFNVGIARWNGGSNAPGTGGLGYFAQGPSNVGGHFFYTGDAAAGSTTERMRITTTGNVGIGTTNPGGIFAIGEFSATGATQGLRVSDTGRLHDTSTNAAVTVPHYRFYNTNGLVGFISTDGSSTIYNTSSDYRLKEDIQPVADATERLMELKPVNFAWKADGSRTDGFIAHEVQAVVPQAVTGEKDGDDMQQMDHSKLVPLLTAALQEQQALIADLKARLDAANL